MPSQPIPFSIFRPNLPWKLDYFVGVCAIFVANTKTRMAGVNFLNHFIFSFKFQRRKRRTPKFTKTREEKALSIHTTKQRLLPSLSRYLLHFVSFFFFHSRTPDEGAHKNPTLSFFSNHKDFSNHYHSSCSLSFFHSRTFSHTSPSQSTMMT